MSLMFLEPARPAPNSKAGSFWDEKRDAQLMDLWAKGVSASAIAETMGAKSRNAVIGRVHRNRDKAKRGNFAADFADRQRKPAHPANHRRPRGDTGGGTVTSIKARGGENGLNLNSPRPRVELSTSPEAPDDRTLCLFLELVPGQCHFPVDRDPAQQWFCGMPVAERDPPTSYCGFHHRKTHQPLDRTKRGSTFRVFNNR